MKDMATRTDAWIELNPGHWAQWGATPEADDAFIYRFFDPDENATKFRLDIVTTRGGRGSIHKTLAAAMRRGDEELDK